MITLKKLYHTHDDRYYTETEVDTISGALIAQIDSKPDTLLELEDTPSSYEEGKVLRSTISGTEWSTISGVAGGTSFHSELYELDYASSGHIGFQPAGDYITDLEMTTISGDIVDQIPNDFDDRYYTESELDAGQLDSRYYTESEIDTISGALSSEIDSDITTHSVSADHDDRYYTESELDAGQLDNRYYTESEIDTISGALSSEIDSDITTHAVSAEHDDRYYTESEVDTLITTLSGKLDDHDELNNLDYASSGHTGFQPAGDYLADAEFTIYSGTLQTQIDGKSDTTHLHDGRYYTESEIDTISGALSSEIDSDITTHAVSAEHDDRYYTESEIDTISGALSSEIDSDITTHAVSADHDDRYYTETELNAGQLDDRYYTETEVDDAFVTFSGTIDHDTLTNFAENEHFTEASIDKYTKVEVNTISGALSTEIDGDITTHKTDYIDGPLSSQVLTGMFISEGTNAGTGKVAAGTALLRTTDSDSGVLEKISLSEQDNIAITVSGIAYRTVLQYNSGSPQIVLQESRPNYTTDITLGKFWREPNNTVHYKSTGRRLSDGVAKLHHRAERIRPWEMCTKIQIADEGSKKWSIAAGHIYKGINEFDFDIFNTTISGHTFIYTYYNGSDWVYVNDQTDINVDQYNNVATGLATCNRYKCDWVFIHPDMPHVFVVYGQDNDKRGNIEISTVPNVPDLVDLFGMLIGRIIIDGGVATFVGIEMVQHTTFNTTTVVDHNDLSNLGGGTTDEYYHLTNAQHTDLTDSGDSSSHKHDDRYYTETEIDTISGALSSEIDSDITTHAVSADHDGRYYTESELDTGQLDGRYYTESEVDQNFVTFSGTIDHNTIQNTHNLTTDIDHGGLAGVGDDDHTQYIKGSEFTQVSGVLVGTGAGTFQEETGNTLRASLGLVIGTDILVEQTINVPHTVPTGETRIVGTYEQLSVHGGVLTLEGDLDLEGNSELYVLA